MKKLMKKFQADFLTNILILVISFVLGIAFLLLWLFLFESSPSTACDATFIDAAVFLGVGGLMAMYHYGSFDLLGYGFVSIGNIFYRPLKVEKKYDDLIDYREKKAEKRKDHGYYFISFLFLGVLFLVAAITLMFISWGQRPAAETLVLFCA